METYITQFKSLSTAIQNGKPAPHKAILLLSVIDLIAQGELQSNRITLSDALCKRFRQNWRTYINDGRESKSTLIKTPFKWNNLIMAERAKRIFQIVWDRVFEWLK